MNIIPRSNGAFEPDDGVWTLKSNMTVNTGGFEEYCIDAFLARTGIKMSVVAEKADLTLVREADFATEEYSLAVSTGEAVVRAASEAGVILALTTLFLCSKPEGVPCFTLQNDAPKYAYRGLMLDCARHFFSVAEVKKIIEHVSLTKINKLHWHLTDDQGWRIESKAYPELHEGIPYYKWDEIREIVSYAKVRNVEVIPEIDMPGHVASAVHIFPWLSCAEKQIKRPTGGGVYKAILCAGKESTFEFVFNVLDEVAALFESPLFHIGGDEAPKFEWEACPECRKRLESLGLNSFEDLQGYFTGRVAEHLKNKNKEIICWNETLRSSSLPDGLTIQYWMPGQDDAKTAEFLNKGRQVIFSDMFHLYLDYPHAIIPLKRVYEYVPAVGGTPCGDNPNILGLEACLWSERVETEERLEKMIFPRIFALAETGWSGCEKDYNDFMRRLEELTGRIRSKGICCAEEYDPSKAKLPEAFRELMSGLVSAKEPDENKVDFAQLFTAEQMSGFLRGFGLDSGLLKTLMKPFLGK